MFLATSVDSKSPTPEVRRSDLGTEKLISRSGSYQSRKGSELARPSRCNSELSGSFSNSSGVDAPVCCSQAPVSSIAISEQ